jgi:hypothetical protein
MSVMNFIWRCGIHRVMAGSEEEYRGRIGGMLWQPGSKLDLSGYGFSVN